MTKGASVTDVGAIESLGGMGAASLSKNPLRIHLTLSIPGHRPPTIQVRALELFDIDA